MFHPIDYNNWDRREIYELFDGYTYCLTVEVDVTHFLKVLKENQKILSIHLLLYRKNGK